MQRDDAVPLDAVAQGTLRTVRTCNAIFPAIPALNFWTPTQKTSVLNYRFSLLDSGRLALTCRRRVPISAALPPCERLQRAAGQGGHHRLHEHDQCGFCRSVPGHITRVSGVSGASYKLGFRPLSGLPSPLGSPNGVLQMSIRGFWPRIIAVAVLAPAWSGGE
jgi:hypothetical protein